MDSISSSYSEVQHVVDPPLCSLTPKETEQIHDILSWVYPDSATYKRYKAILCFSQGQKVVDVANALQSKRGTVYLHLQQFNKNGIRGLEHPHQTFLSDEQKQELQHELNSPNLNRPMYDRCSAIIAYSKGRLLRHIAKDLECSIATIHSYINNYRSGGISSLQSRFTLKQLTTNLSDVQIAELYGCIENTLPYALLYKHVQAVLLWNNKLSLYDIARKLSLGSHRVKKVILLYHQEGIEALKNLKKKMDYQDLRGVNLQLTSEQKQYAENYINISTSVPERKRYKVILLFDAGYTIREISKLVKYSEATVMGYLQFFIENGWESLRSEPKRTSKKVKETVLFKHSDVQKQLNMILADLQASSNIRLLYQILQLYYSGYSGPKVATMLECPISLVYKTIHNYKQGGLQALDNH